MNDMGRLMQLAANPQGTSRDDIYLAVASLYRTQGPLLSDRERGLMREILQRLAKDVEMAIRIALAEKLADDKDAPLDLILLLVDDRIEVARPIILRSRKLTDAELLALIPTAGNEHQTACAERPNIGEPVTTELAKSDVESVLVALVRNATAKIAGNTFETLVGKSRRIQSLQEPLAHRDDLPTPLATQMCAWVSDALKTHIVQNYKIAPETLATVLTKATETVQASPPPASAESARKLVEKLAAAGQLRAGFLLRVLHQGQLDLFEIAFAKLIDVDLDGIKRILYETGPRPVALACRAVGIDKCVFSTVFNLSRQSRGLRAAMSSDERGDVDTVFNTFSKTEALARLRTA
jgi:uncharacterized protein (DUF2336 family)